MLEVNLPGFKHLLSTLHGNSGSPIFTNKNGELLAIGIHKGAPTPTSKFNEGRAITAELVVNLLVWEKEMAAQIRFAVITPTAIKREEDPKVWLEQQKLKIEVALLNYAEQSVSIDELRPKIDPSPNPFRPNQSSCRRMKPRRTNLCPFFLRRLLLPCNLRLWRLARNTFYRLRMRSSRSVLQSRGRSQSSP